MMKKHTPGPWHIYKGRGLYVDSSVAGSICKIAEKRASEKEANARLIAAAPELYEAADAMLDALSDYMLDCGLEVLAQRLRRRASVSTATKGDVIMALKTAGDKLAEVMRRCE